MTGEPVARFERLMRRGSFLDQLSRWVAFVGLIGLLIVALVTMADVLLRWLFSAPIEGLEDINKLVFAIVCASCFPAGLVQGHNVTVRLMGALIGRRGQWLESFGAVLTLLFFLFLASQVFAFAWDEAKHGRYTQTLELATAPWWFVVAVILAICVPIQIVAALMRLTAAAAGRVPDTGGHDATPEYLADAMAEHNKKPEGA